MLRRNLYRVLDASGMEHAHPQVLNASIAFDEMLNHYQRHRRSHTLQPQEASGMPPRPLTRRREVG